MGVYLGFTSFALPPYFCHGIHWHCWLGIPASVYKSRLYKMKKKSKSTHKTTPKHNLFFEQKSMLCCVACELLVSVVFDFHSSPRVFFLKPSSLLGSAALNGKRIGKDKAIPLIETHQKKKGGGEVINLGHFRLDEQLGNGYFTPKNWNSRLPLTFDWKLWKSQLMGVKADLIFLLVLSEEGEQLGSKRKAEMKMWKSYTFPLCSGL